MTSQRRNMPSTNSASSLHLPAPSDWCHPLHPSPRSLPCPTRWSMASWSGKGSLHGHVNCWGDDDETDGPDVSTLQVATTRCCSVSYYSPRDCTKGGSWWDCKVGGRCNDWAFSCLLYRPHVLSRGSGHVVVVLGCRCVIISWACCCRIMVVWWYRPMSSLTRFCIVSLRWWWTAKQSSFVVWMPHRFWQRGTWGCVWLWEWGGKLY